MALSLVSFYGEKSKEFTSYLEAIQKLIFQQLADHFQPYSIAQMHGTIIGLETERIGEHTFSKWCLQNNIQKGPVKKGIQKYLQQDPPIHFIKFGGFKSNIDYGFLSRNEHPYARSFSIQGNTMVINGWPGYMIQERWSISNELYQWRSQLENFNYCHKWNSQDNRDNDLFMVLGRFNPDHIDDGVMNNLLNTMQKFLSDHQIIVPFDKQDVSLVDYRETELPLASTKRYSLSDQLSLSRHLKSEYE